MTIIQGDLLHQKALLVHKRNRKWISYHCIWHSFKQLKKYRKIPISNLYTLKKKHQKMAKKGLRLIIFKHDHDSMVYILNLKFCMHLSNPFPLLVIKPDLVQKAQIWNLMRQCSVNTYTSAHTCSPLRNILGLFSQEFS